MKKIIYILLILLLISCSSNNEEEKMLNDSNNQSKKSNIKWEKFSDIKIYFGHKSVGQNIMEGVQTLIDEKSSKLKIVETSSLDDFKTPIFGHSKNGKNTEPKTKIDAFINIMNNGLGNNVDIAFLKLCYVDITSETDLNDIFNYYKTAFETLKKKYPKTKFIHITVPLSTYKLRTTKGKIKDIVKNIIGKKTIKTSHIENNIKRNKYNEMLRANYKKEYLFDLALIESSYPDGKREYYEKNDIKYNALVPEYTYDGGHLNNLGKRTVADNLLAFFSELK